MGYYTNYDVEITGFKNEEEAEFFEFKEIHKKEGSLNFIKGSGHVDVQQNRVYFNLHQIKWYDWEKDLIGVSKRWTHLLFDIDGEGEEFPDVWKARVRNGESEIVQAKIVFPEFEKILA